MQLKNAKEWPEVYSCKFIEAGIVSYEDSDAGIALLKKETQQVAGLTSHLTQELGMAEYIGSELYNSIKTNTKEQLFNLHYIEMSIEYWNNKGRSEHFKFFNDALVHLNERVSKL